MYALIVVVALPVLWWLVKVVTGLTLPLDRAAAAYMLQRLRQLQIDQVVPPACAAECVAESLAAGSSAVKWSGGKKNLRAETVNHLDYQIDALRLWVRGTGPFDSRPEQHLRELFERHKVPRLGAG